VAYFYSPKSEIEIERNFPLYFRAEVPLFWTQVPSPFGLLFCYECRLQNKKEVKNKGGVLIFNLNKTSPALFFTERKLRLPLLALAPFGVQACRSLQAKSQ